MYIQNLLAAFTLSAVWLMALVWGVALPTAASSGTHYVAPGGDCNGAMPCYATLQEAVAAAAPGAEIRVAQGVYTDVQSITYDSSGWTQTVTQTLFISQSLTVRGGYTVTDWSLSQPLTYPTVINPQGRGRGIYITIPDSQSHITVTIEGLSITGGSATLDAGGLYAYGSNITISNCSIYSNTGGSIGSGLYVAGGTVTLVNSVVRGNDGPDYSYGMVVDGSRQATLRGNRIVRNDNGLFLWNSWAELSNNLIAANAGGGLAISGGEVHAWHTTVADNGQKGIGVGNSGQISASLVLTNTIISGHDTGVQVSGNLFDVSSVRLAATLWHNLTDTQVLEGGRVESTQDLTGDPAFVGSGDYHLTAASPARNRGRSCGVRLDIDGEPRDPLPDLGADEYFDPDSIRSVYLPLVMRGG